MLERILISIGLIIAGLVAYRAIITFQLRRAAAALPGLEGREPGKFLILYFTSPTCAPCKTTQQPALRKVQNLFGDQLQIITIDVMEQPHAAEHWGVMTLPTTFLFDRKGIPGDCNLGVTYAEKLAKQLTSIGANLSESVENAA